MSGIMIWRRVAALRHGFCLASAAPATMEYSRQDAAPGEWNPGAVSGDG
jgi:hypothetical protein